MIFGGIQKAVIQGVCNMSILRKIILSVLFFHLFSVLSFASDVVIIDSVKQFDYAKKCYLKNDYLSAIVEFKKFLSFFPEDIKTCDAKFHVGMSWYNGGKFGEAIIEFKEIVDKESFDNADSGQIKISAYFMLARCHVASGNPVMAEIVLDNYIKITDNNNEKDRARNTIGWIRFETAKWEKARQIFLDISKENKKIYNVDAIIKQLDKTEKIKMKSPRIAGTLAVIPGLGYIYTKRYQDAFVSFLLNGALIYAAYESFHRENYALGGVISFVSFGFYSGSIYGSATSAHKYNRKERRQFIKQTKKEIPSGIQLGVLPDFNRKSLALAMRIQF